MRARHVQRRLAAQDLLTPQLWADGSTSAERLKAQVLRLDAAGSLSAEPPTRTVRRRWRLTVAVALAFALTMLALVVGPGLVGQSGRVAAATPPLLTYQPLATQETASQLLLQLAVAAGQQPAPTAGKYAYVRSQAWRLDFSATTTRTDAGVPVTNGEIVPTFREQWIAADGSGRIWQTRAGQASDVSGPLPPHATLQNRSLPIDPDEMGRVLAASHPHYGTYEWFIAVNDVAEQGPIPPKSQQALLTFLSRQQGISVLGVVADRGDRAGIAVATTAHDEGRTTRYVLIFDRSTGNLLDYEEVTLVDRNLNIALPATTDYNMLIMTGYTDSDTQAPNS